MHACHKAVKLRPVISKDGGPQALRYIKEEGGERKRKRKGKRRREDEKRGEGITASR
jgi:hypothetical protein